MFEKVIFKNAFAIKDNFGILKIKIMARIPRTRCNSYHFFDWLYKYIYIKEI